MDIRVIGHKKLFMDIDKGWYLYISKEHICQCHTQLKVLETYCKHIRLSLRAEYNVYLTGGIIWTPIFKSALMQLQKQ